MFFYATGLTTGEDENKDVKIALSPVFVEVLSVVILHIVCTWSCVAAWASFISTACISDGHSGAHAGECIESHYGNGVVRSICKVAILVSFFSKIVEQ